MNTKKWIWEHQDFPHFNYRLLAKPFGIGDFSPE